MEQSGAGCNHIGIYSEMMHNITCTYFSNLILSENSLVSHTERQSISQKPLTSTLHNTVAKVNSKAIVWSVKF